MPHEVIKFRTLTGTFEAHPTFFRYQDEGHLYKAIARIGRYAKRTWINFLPIGEYVRISILLKGHIEPIVFASTVGVVFSNGKLEALYKAVASRSFSYRVGAYAQQIEEDGQLRYGGATISASGVIAIGSAQMNIRTCNISRRPFELIFQEKKGLFSPGLTISTEEDQDAFLYILRNKFGIQV